ncbi:MAG: radical SAM protein [Deltaproteobacteria bacterium]|nr:radical SAM protein [Deltaproteobacteria bacterium]
MKLEPVRRLLDTHVEKLLAPLLQARSGAGGVKVLSWDVEQGISLFVELGGRVLLIELEPRNDEQPCYERTARFNVCARINFDRANDLTDRERRFVSAIVRMVRHREQLLPLVERPAVSRQMEVREILVDRILFQEGEGHYYLNPYVGCMIGCEFCYVAQRADLSWGMQGLAEMPWGRRLDVKVNAAEVLRRELRDHKPGIVRMSPILTDPYQPVERKYRVTRSCIESMLGTDFVPFVLTRAARALEDIDLLRRFAHAGVGYSIPTDDDRYRQMIEPGADPVDERIAALQAFAEAGIFTAVVIQPLLPMNPEAFADRLAPFVKVVRIDRLQFPERSRHLFRKHGIEHVLDEAWAADTQQRLVARFRQHGVAIDELDNLISFMKR